MVQTKAPDNSSLKTGKKPYSITKPSTQNHDHNANGFDLINKMKKSRSSDQPQKHLPCSSTNAEAALSSPNYMKSTSSSEARKEKPISSFHKVPSSSLKKVRILTKAPNSKPLKSVNKCSTDTCSSTLKDSKFPRFLVLNPGGTESQGASVEKVCPYNYCSLNGHKHNSNPPLKGFLSARRRELRAQRIMKPVTLSTRKGRPCKDDDDEIKEDVGVDLVVDKETDEALTVLLGEEKADFLVEIYVKERKDKAEGVSDVGYEDDLDQEKESALIDEASSEREADGVVDECEYDGGNFGWEKATSITALDELFAECSDAELEEEGRLYLSELEIGDGRSAPSDQESDYTFVDRLGDEILCLLDEEGVKKEDVGIKFLKESLSEESDEFSRDEITDCHVQFSDSDSSVNDVREETEFDQFLQDYGCSDDEKTRELSDLDKKTIEASKIEDEESNSCRSLKTTIRSRKQGENSEELKPSNPREPNYLEVEPEAEREKVDLRHLEMGERRNAEEWTLDYALRRTVNQLVLARKRKVALLVEAFETITPPT